MKVRVVVSIYDFDRDNLMKCMDSVEKQTLDIKQVTCINYTDENAVEDIVNKYKNDFKILTIENRRKELISELMMIDSEKTLDEYIYYIDSNDYIDLNSLNLSFGLSDEDEFNEARAYFEAAKSVYKLYCINKMKFDGELISTLLNNSRMLMGAALTHCDLRNDFDLREEAKVYIINNKSLLDADLDIRINKSNVIYSKNSLNLNRENEIKLFKNSKKIFYMLIPSHGNLGDQAIVYATLQFLQDKYPDYKILKFNYEESHLYTNIISEMALSGDFVVLHGGGNMGNHYIWEEEARRYIISQLHEIPIISFPQTIYFSEDKEGQVELNRSKNVYNSHRALTLLAREETSYKIMKKHFDQCNVLKCPDIVFYLNDKLSLENKNFKREYLTTCFRGDKETYYTLNDKQFLINRLRENFNVLEKDTVVYYKIDGIMREKELLNLWFDFYKSKVVITDRLHGMIFAAITNTPCIVLRSLDYKITESYKWISDLNYIKLTEDFSVENIERLVKELINLEKIDDFHFDVEYFKDIESIVELSCKELELIKSELSPKIIEINSVEIKANVIKSYMEIDCRLKKYFNYFDMTLEYEEDMSMVPKSIAVIPLLANILPIAWFTDSDIILEELDDVFYESIVNIKKAFENMYNMSLGGKVIVKRLVSNRYECDERYISLFSGGVDSLSTVVKNMDKNLELATIWGADIDVNNVAGWKSIQDAVIDIGSKFGLNNVFVRSDFRKCISEGQLDVLCRQLTGCQWWWESIQHGIALLGHLVPYAYKHKLKSIIIPGTLCEAYEKKNGKTKLASDPTIDDEFNFASCKTVHEGFEYSRQDKIKNISDYKNTVDYDFDTRVCFNSVDGKNCNRCRKCSITILGLINEKQDPNKFGFNIDDELLFDMKKRFENEFYFAPFALEWWRDIKRRFNEESEFWSKYNSVKWVMDIDTSEEYNQKKI